MNQPVYWSTLTAAVVVLAVLRLRTGHPLLLSRRAIPLRRWEWTTAALGVAALVFHCGAMFFAVWVDAVPGLQTPAAAVRALNGTSQWAYWGPAVMLLASMRRAWWPGPILLAATLSGVGVTMFWSYPLPAHLSWLAALIATGSAVFAVLITRPPPQLRPAHPRSDR